MNKLKPIKPAKVPKYIKMRMRNRKIEQKRKAKEELEGEIKIPQYIKIKVRNQMREERRKAKELKRKPESELSILMRKKRKLDHRRSLN